jgi:hypothetical protein
MAKLKMSSNVLRVLPIVTLTPPNDTMGTTPTGTVLLTFKSQLFGILAIAFSLGPLNNDGITANKVIMPNTRQA